MMINPFIISCLLTSILSFALGGFVLVKNKQGKTNPTPPALARGFEEKYPNTTLHPHPKEQGFTGGGVNIACFLLCAAIGIWSFGYFASLTVKSHDLALFYARVLSLGTIFIPITFFHFVSALLGIIERKKRLLIAGYLLASVFLLFDTFAASKPHPLVCGKYTPLSINPETSPCLQTGENRRVDFTPLIVRDVKPKLDFRYYSVAGYLYLPLLIIFFGYAVYSHMLMVKYGKGLRGYRRSQLKYIFIASVIAFVGLITNFWLIFDIQIYPFGNFILLFYPIIITYATLQRRLMDIELVIQKTAVFAVVFGFLVGVFILAILVGEQILSPYIGKREWFITGLALLIVTFAVRPIDKFVYNTVGRRLFKKRYEYQKALLIAATGMATVRDPRELLQLIVHIVSKKMRLESVSILIYDEKHNHYQLKAAHGSKKYPELHFSISATDPFVEWLKEKRQALVLEELQEWISDKKSRPAEAVLASELMRIQERMQTLGSNVCVPAFCRNELLGILVLGDKKSGDLFSQDDLNLFSTLADEAAIAIKNSQLYFEIEEKAKEMGQLYKREHRLFIHAAIAFAAAIDARDAYTHGHSERVTNYSLTILDYLKPTPETESNPMFRQRLQIAGILHDVGKIGVPDNILHKPTALNPEESEEMKKHSVTGAQIVSHIRGLHDIIGGIRHHHERYDGTGYPDGLRSDDIPFMGRIIAVADAYDAMTSERPYRKKMAADVAKEEIKNNSSTQFDPFIVAAFLKAFGEGKIKGAIEGRKRAVDIRL